MLPLDDPVLPFVEMPRPLQESNVVGKGGAAGFLGKAYDPYRLYQDPNKPIRLEDLSLRQEVPPQRLKDRFALLKGINKSMPDLEKAVGQYAVDEYYERAYDLVLSGKARAAFDLEQEPVAVRERYGRTTFGQGALMARRLVEAGTRFVQLNWPSVANGNPETTAWDTHAANFGPLKNLHCPVLDQALSALLEDMDDRGLLEETLVVTVGEFGRSPRLGVSTSGNTNSPDGRDHWPYCYTALVAGAGIARGALYGESDETGSSPREKPVHPNDLLASVYFSLGIDPHMEVLNHLDQPRELVKGTPCWICGGSSTGIGWTNGISAPTTAAGRIPHVCLPVESAPLQDGQRVDRESFHDLIQFQILVVAVDPAVVPRPQLGRDRLRKLHPCRCKARAPMHRLGAAPSCTSPRDARGGLTVRGESPA